MKKQPENPEELKYYKKLVEDAHNHLLEANKTLQELYKLFAEIGEKLKDEA